MIRLLQIISYIAMAGAACAVGFAAVFGLRDDAQRDKFLAQPSVVELFKSDSDKPGKIPDQISPLVKQSQAFALRINPPAPKVALPSRGEKTSSEPKPARPTPAKVEAKFSVIGTCLNPLQPERSLVLVDMPAKGYRWLRQGEKVGYLIIEEVKGGGIVIRDGNRTYEQAVVERPEHVNLLKGGRRDRVEAVLLQSDAGSSGSEAFASQKRERIRVLPAPGPSPQRIPAGADKEPTEEEIKEALEFFNMALGEAGAGMEPNGQEQSATAAGDEEEDATEPNDEEEGAAALNEDEAGIALSEEEAGSLDEIPAMQEGGSQEDSVQGDQTGKDQAPSASPISRMRRIRRSRK
ncbi:MAG: hypothetical protein ABIG61_08410 [Planctomycetota bacterium]